MYKYISNTLKEKRIAQKILNEIENNILILKYIPYAFSIVDFNFKRKYEYRKLLIRNYLVIYRIDEKNKYVYIVKIIHIRKNYLNDK